MKIENISKMDNKDVKKNIGQLGLKVSGDTVILNTKEIIYCSSNNIYINTKIYLEKKFPNKPNNHQKDDLVQNIMFNEPYLCYDKDDLGNGKCSSFHLKHNFHNYLIEESFRPLTTKLNYHWERNQLNSFLKGFIRDEIGRYIIEGDKGITFIRNDIEPTIDNFHIKTEDEILEEYNLGKSNKEEDETNLKNIPDLWPLLSSSKNYLIVTTATCIYIYSFDINFSNKKYNLIYDADKAYVHTNNVIDTYNEQVKMRVRK